MAHTCIRSDAGRCRGRTVPTERFHPWRTLHAVHAGLELHQSLVQVTAGMPSSSHLWVYSRSLPAIIRLTQVASEARASHLARAVSAIWPDSLKTSTPIR